MESSGTNWSEAAEDLVDKGDAEKVIIGLESVVSKLGKEATDVSSSPELAPNLLDLSRLYSMKADEVHRVHSKGDLNAAKNSSSPPDGLSTTCDSTNTVSTSGQDDWEAVADHAPDELLSPGKLPKISKLTLEDNQVKGLKRRGRGTFLYGKDTLYSELTSDDSDDEEHKAESPSPAGDTKITDSMYGTRHVLVLADLPLSTRTFELEKMVERFKDRGVVIRWVNDTVALAVFRSPSIALEASTKIQFPFTMRILEENDQLLGSIPQRDLEPPRVRPKTSVSAAQRLIANGMGIRLEGSPGSGSSEHRRQEEARRNRIVSRQNMRDEAWGDDIN